MTASELILQKALVGSDLDSSQWNQIQAGLRNRAFFSSRVAEVNILSAMRERAAEYAQGGTDLSKIRMQLREDLRRMHYEPRPGEENTIKDLFTQSRLDVIIKTNVAQARGYMQYAKGMSPGAFAAFPAQEFVRVRHSRHPRTDWPQRWAKAGGKMHGGKMIAMKDDPVWKRLGELGPFGNSYPPFDWGSGMGVMDVDRAEAERLGLVTREELRSKVQQLREKPLPDFNRDMQATVPNLRSDSLCGQILKDNFGDQITIENSVVHWQGNLIQDVISGKREKARLGMASERLLSKMSDVAPKEDIDAFRQMNPSFNKNTFLDHAKKHLGDSEKRMADNIPCAAADYDLMPAIWYNPDRIVKVKNHHYVLELETFDGGYLQLAMNTMRGFSSFYKTKFPLGAAPGNAPIIPLGP